jgi:hypothetical protein
MKIDFDSPKTTSKTVWFNGETDDERKFTIVATWDEWDDWTADSSEIMWDDEAGNEDECQEIIHEFLSQMNS